jgi:hypothetical protein
MDDSYLGPEPKSTMFPIGSSTSAIGSAPSSPQPNTGRKITNFFIPRPFSLILAGWIPHVLLRGKLYTKSDYLCTGIALPL